MGKLDSGLPAPGQNMTKCMDDLLPPSTHPQRAFQGRTKSEVYLCAPQPGFVFVVVITGFNGYYKSSLDDTCMRVLILLFHSHKAYL